MDTEQIENEAAELAQELLDAGAARLVLNREAFGHLVMGMIVNLLADEGLDLDVGQLAFCKALDVWDEQDTKPVKVHAVIHDYPDGSIGVRLFELEQRARLHVREVIAEVENDGKVPDNLIKYPFTKAEQDAWNEKQMGSESLFVVETEVN